MNTLTSSESPPYGIDADTWSQLPLHIKNEIRNTPSIQSYTYTPSPSPSHSDNTRTHTHTPSHSDNTRTHTPIHTHTHTQSHHMNRKQSTLSIHTLIYHHNDEITKDPTFPCDHTSIDGHPVCSSHEIPQCLCHKPMIRRQVYKAGANQGRYYYTCPIKGCSSFSWADQRPQQMRSECIQWEPFTVTQGWKLVGSNGFKADDIIQGGVGDCWFLSAVVVLCERNDLLSRVVVDKALTPSGLQRFCFFLAGAWKTISVDCFLPCHSDIQSRGKRKRGAVQRLVYSRSKQSQLWVPLLEKAYAKAHNCYKAISGGFITEALFDLTGCPCEAIHLASPGFDSEKTWQTLMQYRSAGFPMGCSTDFSGEGIVGNHAYSILDVREIVGVSVGEQVSIRSYFQSQSTENSGGRSVNKMSKSAEEECREEVLNSGVLRLLRIRNPWGKVEWKGTFSSHSTLWTSRLRAMLCPQNKTSNDGTFWITYHDFLRRYATVDVCKAYSTGDWRVVCVRDDISRSTRGISAVSWFRLLIPPALEPVHLYISLVQASKRGGFAGDSTAKSYWYSDLSLLIHRMTPSGAYDCIAAVFTFPTRNSFPLEMHLDAGEYIVTVVRLNPSVIQDQSYYLHTYSNRAITLTKHPNTERKYSRSSICGVDINSAEVQLVSLLRSVSMGANPHGVTVSPICASDTAVVYAMRGNGINVLYACSLSGDSDSSVANWTGECASNFGECISVLSLNLTVNSRLKVITPYMYSGDGMMTSTIIHDITRRVEKSQCKLYFSSLPPCSVKILAVIYDQQCADAFELQDALYVQSADCYDVFGTNTHVEEKETLKAVLRVEKFVQSKENIVYPIYFGTYT